MNDPPFGRARLSGRRDDPAEWEVVGGLIVVADDDPSIRALVSFKLTKAGATVLQAANGAEAVKACRQGTVDLAVLDIDMPYLTGFEVLEELRSHPATAMLPVLLLTAHTLPGGAVKGIGLGAHDYIRKPFDLDELQARVDSAVLLGRRTRELANSEAAFRGLFEGSHTAMSVVGLDGRLRRVNQAWAELLGRSAADAAGIDTYALVHPEDRAQYGQVIVDMHGKGVDHDRGRMRILRPDGEVRWCDVSTTLVRDHSGAPAYLYRVLVDVTDEVLANEALRARYADDGLSERRGDG